MLNISKLVNQIKELDTVGAVQTLRAYELRRRTRKAQKLLECANKRVFSSKGFGARDVEGFQTFDDMFVGFALHDTFDLPDDSRNAEYAVHTGALEAIEANPNGETPDYEWIVQYISANPPSRKRGGVFARLPGHETYVDVRKLKTVLMILGGDIMMHVHPDPFKPIGFVSENGYAILVPCRTPHQALM